MNTMPTTEMDVGLHLYLSIPHWEAIALERRIGVKSTVGCVDATVTYLTRTHLFRLNLFMEAILNQRVYIVLLGVARLRHSNY